MNKVLKVILIVLGVIIGLAVIFISWGSYANYKIQQFSKNVDISVTKNQKDDTTEIVYLINNNSNKTQTLDSIDIGSQAFAAAEFIGVNLKQDDEYGVWGMHVFEFHEKIEPSQSLEVIFNFKPKDDQADFVETDICFTRSTSCIGRSFSI